MLSSVCGVIKHLCPMEVLAPVGFGWAEARLGLGKSVASVGEGRVRDGDTIRAVGDRVGAPVLAVSGGMGALVSSCWEWQELLAFPPGHGRQARTVLNVCPNPSSAALPAEPP